MKRQGFTLVELMIVVSILGILAAIVVPQFANSSQEAADSAAKNILHTVRVQIELYKMQHNGMAPGYVGSGTATNTELINQFIGTSTIAGVAKDVKIPADPFLYGPYLIKMPKNPFNELTTIKPVAASVTDFSTAVDEKTGWLYQKETGTFKINKSGSDVDEMAYVDY